MNSAMLKRLEKLELARPVEKGQWLIVPFPDYVPVGFKGRVIVTGVPRHGDAL